MKRAIRDLSPAYFAMVMATGIVSIAAHLYDMPAIADVLFAGNIVAYLVLLVLTGLRLLWFPRAFFADIADHQRGPGNLTLVAGSCVLGSQFAMITHEQAIADVLWGVSVVLWIVLIYGIFAALSVKRDKPGLAQGINGGWLLAVVSTQAIAVLGALIAPHWAQPYRVELNFLALSMWLWGGMLYLWMA
ncbi:MAG TPA: tellurite resistance/C4-dicarboxylate transporter family protein, partial [Reyranella sp.]